MAGANSEEFEASARDCVVISMPELDKKNMGGTMRLGSRKTIFQPNSEWAKIRALYDDAQEIEERHRHRYEINPEYIARLEAAGLHFVGRDETGQRMEIFEIKDHPYFVGKCHVHTEIIWLNIADSASRHTIPRRVPVEGAQPKRMYHNWLSF